jgi:hypothetical protein
MGWHKVQKVKMCINAFRGDDEIELAFPESWDVTECRMEGHDKPAMSKDEMPRHETYRPPAQSNTRCEGASSSTCCQTHPGQPHHFPVLRSHAGGVTDEQIRFVRAGDPSTTDREFVGKLERDVEKYPVYNHNVWENLVDVGRLSRHTGKGQPGIRLV